MALLTEEQINQLLKMASVTSTARSYHEELCEWNEKQATQQFEPDWEKISSSATKVYLDAVWFNAEMKEIDRTTICGWNRPVTPHPHAEIMMKYAEVAARRVDPWVEFEVKSGEEFSWSTCTSFICFRAEYEYRHIGDNK
jgi:hypothetical protein